VKLFFPLLLTYGAPLLISQQSSQHCSSSQPVVIAYGNGIRTTYPQAYKRDLPHLQAKVTTLLPANGIDPNNVAFCVVYDSTYVESQSTSLSQRGDLIDGPLQIFQGFLQLQLQTPQQFWYWWSNIPAAPPIFNQIEEDIGIGVETAISSLLQPDIFKQLSIYQTALANGQTVIVVAHSRGTFTQTRHTTICFHRRLRRVSTGLR
jgi:hypothetical protein